MKKEVGDILTIKGKECAVIDAILYEGKDYILVNVYENDEPTEKLIAYETTNNNTVIEVKEQKILDRILPIFSKNVQRVINTIQAKEKFDIN